MRSSGVIQQESSTLPSRLEVQRLAAMELDRDLITMYTSVRVTLLLGLALLPQAAARALDCQALNDQRDQLVRRAMKQEVVVLHELRLKLCPQQEASATAEDSASESQLDFGAYIRCRQQAEVQLQNTKPVLYTNPSGFRWFTPQGARLAREADLLLREMQQHCAAPSPAGPPP